MSQEMTNRPAPVLVKSVPIWPALKEGFLFPLLVHKGKWAAFGWHKLFMTFFTGVVMLFVSPSLKGVVAFNSVVLIELTSCRLIAFALRPFTKSGIVHDSHTAFWELGDEVLDDPCIKDLGIDGCGTQVHQEECAP